MSFIHEFDETLQMMRMGRGRDMQGDYRVAGYIPLSGLRGSQVA